MANDPSAIIGELKTAVLSWKDYQTGRIDTLDQRMNELEVRMAKPSYGSDSGTATGGCKALVDKIVENRDILQKSGRLIVEVPSLLPDRKSTIVSTGITTPIALGAIEVGGRPEYNVRGLFRTFPAEGASVFRVRENVYTNNASPQVEANPKQESTMTFTAGTIPVETFAHYVNVSRQAFDDVVGLAAYLDTSLLWGLEKKIEAEILAGSGVSPDLDGIIGHATAFDTNLLSTSAGWNYADVLAAAAVQLRNLGFRCDSFIISPTDWYRIETMKDSTKRYIIGDPRAALAEALWNRRVVDSPELNAGTFIALDSRRFHIRQRMNATVDISYEHGTNFTSNLCTIRAEERLAFVVGRADAAVYGSINSSPA